MATECPTSAISEIGATAGLIWQVLSENGSLSIAKLVKEVDAPRDTVMQALGWLAREDKISIDDESSRTRIVSLR